MHYAGLRVPPQSEEKLTKFGSAIAIRRFRGTPAQQSVGFVAQLTVTTAGSTVKTWGNELTLIFSFLAFLAPLREDYPCAPSYATYESRIAAF